MEKSFVFHDPTGRRWVRFRSGSQVFGIFLCLVAVVFALSLASHPQLPVLGLPPVEHLPNFKEVPHIIRGERVEKNLPFKFDKNVKYVRSASPVVHQRTAASAKEGQPVVFGFYVNWDEASIVS